MNRRSIVAIIGCALASMAMAGPLNAAWFAPNDLAAVEADVAARYGEIDHADGNTVSQWVAAGDPVVWVDVRTPREFAVSHVPGAHRVDPDADIDAALSAIGPVPSGATVVMYCSVGVRSSKLAQRTQAALESRGASRVVNLKGGIFRWHADRRPLVDARGPTDAVHGFDRRWSKRIPRQDAPIVVDP